MKRIAASFALLLLASANAALADGKTVAVSGDSVPSNCAAHADFGLELNGNLTGCWAMFVQHSKCRELNGFALSTKLGREEFEGKLDGEPIKFDASYVTTATWPAGSCLQPAPEKLITAGCIHYISGANVGGLMRFYAVIPTIGKGPTNFFYEGVLTRD